MSKLLLREVLGALTGLIEIASMQIGTFVRIPKGVDGPLPTAMRMADKLRAAIDRPEQKSVTDLTDEEIIALRKSSYGGRFGVPGRGQWSDSLKFAREVLEAQKNKQLFSE